MLGYLASKKFNESQIWDYASLICFEEVGCTIKEHRGKLFNKALIELVKQINPGDQLYFETKMTVRGSRTYFEFVNVEPRVFTACDVCGKPAHASSQCVVDDSERLTGCFEMVYKTELESGIKLVLRRDTTQFTYIQWNNSPFTDKFEVGQTVEVVGWRDNDRITRLRVLQKKI